MAKAEYHFGWHSVESILQQQPELVLGIYLLKGREDARSKEVTRLAKTLDITIQQAGKDTLTRLAGSEFHQGVMVSVRPAPVLNEEDLDTLIAQTPDVLLLILDQITDPHNLGACLRTAAAMGVHALVTTRDRAAGLTPTARKVAAGGAEIVPFIQVTNLARTLKSIQEQGVFVVGTLLDDTAKPLQACDLKGKLAIVMGAEDTGLRRLTIDSCDQLAYIPMSGKLQSLNVSVACGMALYEATRQRGV